MRVSPTISLTAPNTWYPIPTYMQGFWEFFMSMPFTLEESHQTLALQGLICYGWGGFTPFLQEVGTPTSWRALPFHRWQVTGLLVFLIQRTLLDHVISFRILPLENDSQMVKASRLVPEMRTTFVNIMWDGKWLHSVNSLSNCIYLGLLIGTC